MRTLHATEQLEILLHQLEKIRYGVIGLSEVRWPGEGEITWIHDNIIFWKTGWKTRAGSGDGAEEGGNPGTYRVQTNGTKDD